ncbi:HD-GYP domain-containing protein [Acidaminobacter sp. JC074]|uniref:HD-GYP domain-containing protein n=1 Tax=Acidaminobacter sp. JC074 TaxID=2530199 RepID=UPI001F112C67|nr:HD-GYP domain-containing protein [Acidaminobacter sp. JC074]MCH4890425.1 HD-GYP domain-containing protein [Acidaminobacter sp. JC074]
MKNNIKLRMIIGFTVFFFAVLAVMVGYTSFNFREIMLHKDLKDFNDALAEVKDGYDYNSPRFLKEASEMFGGMVVIIDESSFRDFRELNQDVVNEIKEALTMSDSYPMTAERERIYAGRLNESQILVNIKLQSIFNDMSSMLSRYLSLASLIIFTILLFAAYFYISYFERKMTFQAQKEILYSLGKTADAHFGENGAHIERVSEMMYRFARVLGHSKKECEMLKIASMMHDIGKIAIPDSILKKPGRLTEEEMAKMKTHTIEGQKILGDSSLPIIMNARKIAQFHHERIDGKGYPQGLKGKQIPKYARMMAIVDVFDALTNDRVYKKAFSYTDALELMLKESGKQFDKSLLRVFVSNLNYITGQEIDFKLELTETDNGEGCYIV